MCEKNFDPSMVRSSIGFLVDVKSGCKWNPAAESDELQRNLRKGYREKFDIKWFREMIGDDVEKVERITPWHFPRSNPGRLRLEVVSEKNINRGTRRLCIRVWENIGYFRSVAKGVGREFLKAPTKVAKVGASSYYTEGFVSDMVQVSVANFPYPTGRGNTGLANFANAFIVKSIRLGDNRGYQPFSIAGDSGAAVFIDKGMDENNQRHLQALGMILGGFILKEKNEQTNTEEEIPCTLVLPIDHVLDSFGLRLCGVGI